MLFVGWEGVGLCSYLLIGFWYEKDAAADAGKKAFIVNRIGDFGFVLGIIADLGRPSARWTSSSSVVRERAARDAVGSAAIYHRDRLLLFVGAVRQVAPRSRSTSGCPTRWRARRRSPR